MTRRSLVGLVLLVGLLLGLVYEPDSGTAVNIGPPDVVGMLTGPNHAKPLPRVVTMADVVPPTTVAVVLLVLLAQLSAVGPVHDGRADHRHRSVLWSVVRARRGPPAPLPASRLAFAV